MRYRYVVATRRGGPEVLTTRTGELPAPGPGEARVRVAAAGVSYGDILLRTGVIPGGAKPPFTPGFDIVGTVESTGAGVDAPRPGQQVTALIRQGGYTSAIVLPARRLVAVPPELPAVQVAAAVLNYFVAYQMLHRVAKVHSGQWILVHGAAGGVGMALLQLASLVGVHSIGTSSPGKAAIVSQLGARHLDYRREDFVAAANDLPGGGFQAAFDPVGGTHFRRSYRALVKGGILVGYGQSAALRDGKARRVTGAVGFLGGIVLPKLLPDRRATTFYNAWALERSLPTAYRDDLETVLDLLASGKIKPRIAGEYPLAQAGAAHTLLESATAAGKVILVTGEPS